LNQPINNLEKEMNNGNDVNQRDAENFEASDNESVQQNQFRNDSFTFDDDLNDDGDNAEYPEWHASSQNDNHAVGEETHFDNENTQENRQAEQSAEASSVESNAESNRQNRFSANNLKNFLKFLVVLVVVGGGIMLATSKGDKGKTGKTGTAESEEEHEIKIGDVCMLTIFHNGNFINFSKVTRFFRCSCRPVAAI